MTIDTIEPASAPETIPSEEERFPGVHEAYSFVLPSYQMLMTRFEAADNRIATLLNFAATLTLGAPPLLRTLNSGLSLRAPAFLLAVTLFVALAGVALYGRIYGHLTVPHPMRIYQHHLQRSSWDFKKSQIYYAGLHFDQNARAVWTKGVIANIMTGLFVWEILAFITWAVVA